MSGNCGYSTQPIINAEGTVYTWSNEGCNAPKLSAFNPNGTIKWEFSGLNSAPLTPAIGSNGTIYVPTNNSGVYALNPNGTEKWHFFVDGMSSIEGITIGNDGTLYFMAYVPTGNVYSGTNLYALNPDGSEKWFTGGPRGGMTVPAVGADGTVYAVWKGFINVQDEQLGCLGAYTPQGTSKWSVGLGYGVGSAPTVGPDGNIYVIAGNAWYTGNHTLFAYSPNGVKLWQSGSEQGKFDHTPVIFSNGNILMAENWSVYCGSYMYWPVYCSWSQIRIFSPAGEVIQAIGPFENSSINTWPIIDEEGNMYIARTFYGGWLPSCTAYSLDSLNSSGTIRWSYPTPCSSSWDNPAIDSNGNLYAVLREFQPDAGNYKYSLYAFVGAGYGQPTYSISGTVTYNGSGLGNATVTLSGAASKTTTTGSNGSYSFTSLPNGSYTITPSLSGYTFNPSPRNVTISSGNVTGQDFIANTPTLSIISIEPIQVIENIPLIKDKATMVRVKVKLDNADELPNVTCRTNFGNEPRELTKTLINYEGTTYVLPSHSITIQQFHEGRKNSSPETFKYRLKVWESQYGITAYNFEDLTNPLYPRNEGPLSINAEIFADNGKITKTSEPVTVNVKSFNNTYHSRIIFKLVSENGSIDDFVNKMGMRGLEDFALHQFQYLISTYPIPDPEDMSPFEFLPSILKQGDWPISQHGRANFFKFLLQGSLDTIAGWSRVVYIVPQGE
jgi:hypothetical protein